MKSGHSHTPNSSLVKHTHTHCHPLHLTCYWFSLQTSSYFHRINIRHLGKLAASYFCLYSRTLILDTWIDSKVWNINIFISNETWSGRRTKFGTMSNEMVKRGVKGTEKKISTNEIKWNGCEQTIWQNRKISLNKKKTKTHRISSRSNNNNNCGKIPWAEI